MKGSQMLTHHKRGLHIPIHHKRGLQMLTHHISGLHYADSPQEGFTDNSAHLAQQQVIDAGLQQRVVEWGGWYPLSSAPCKQHQCITTFVCLFVCLFTEGL